MSKASTKASSKSAAPAISTRELTPLEWQALALKAKEATGQRAALLSGQGQVVDITVRLIGAINVAENGTTTSTKKPAADRLLAAVLDCLGPRMRKSLIESLQKTFAGGADPVFSLDAEADAIDLIESLTERTTVPRSGSVTGAINLTVL